MKFLLLSALVALCAVTRLWCQEMDPKEEADYWSSDQIQVRFRPPDQRRPQVCVQRTPQSWFHLQRELNPHLMFLWSELTLLFDDVIKENVKTGFFSSWK